MTTAIIVPARLASTRFPRKLLHEVRGKPIILWTADRIHAEAPEFPLWFAVDDEQLLTVLAGAGYQAMLTDVGHSCGTDRIAEANRRIGAEFVINVQADEPLVTGAQIRQLARLIQGVAPMATLGYPLTHERDYLDPNHVKCVMDAQGFALLFSRAPVPYFRDASGHFDLSLAAALPLLVHVGLYAYHRDFLEAFSQMAPGRLEELEKLEQLRALERGHRIAVGITAEGLIAIDTPQQAAEFERALKEPSTA